MNELCLLVGARIRELRREAGLTQDDLSSGIVTRNMLSMIESGRSLPSLDTLADISLRLGVPVGYIFADEREETMYKRYMSIDRLRRLFREGKYAELISETGEIGWLDEELSAMLAVAEISEGIALFEDCRPQLADVHFERAQSLCEGTVAKSYVENTVRFSEEIRDAMRSRRIQGNLCDISDYFPCAIPPELFSYLSALRMIENGDVRGASSLATSGLISSEQYKNHILGTVYASDGDDDRAFALLKKAASDKPKGFFSLTRIYTDIELCAQKLGDYENAYKYSAKHLELVERLGE